MTRRGATLTGFGAVLLWALLALLTSLSGQVPPFQLAAMSFAIGGLVGLAVNLRRPGAFGVLRQPWPVWAVGVGGLFGYHFLYFSALRAAPPIEASLIAYLWPLLIVVFSALLPGERLRWYHVLGAGLGFLGAGLIVTGGTSLGLSPEHSGGYALALAAAAVWSVYSVVSRSFAAVPTETVTFYCLAAAGLSAICHMALETTVAPSGAVQWMAILGLGLGPLGLAFFLWDRGMKQGDIQVLGALSYAAPLLSTVVLVAAGLSPATPVIAVACLLITVGAIVASLDLFRAEVSRSGRE